MPLTGGRRQANVARRIPFYLKDYHPLAAVITRFCDPRSYPFYVALFGLREAPEL